MPLGVRLALATRNAAVSTPRCPKVCFSGSSSERSQHSPYVWFQPVSSPQQTGRLQKVHELQGFLSCVERFLHLSQQSCAEVAR